MEAAKLGKHTQSRLPASRARGSALWGGAWAGAMVGRVGVEWKVEGKQKKEWMDHLLLGWYGR